MIPASVQSDHSGTPLQRFFRTQPGSLGLSHLRSATGQLDVHITFPPTPKEEEEARKTQSQKHLPPFNPTLLLGVPVQPTTPCLQSFESKTPGARSRSPGSWPWAPSPSAAWRGGCRPFCFAWPPRDTATAVDGAVGFRIF